MGRVKQKTLIKPFRLTERQWERFSQLPKRMGAHWTFTDVVIEALEQLDRQTLVHNSYIPPPVAPAPLYDAADQVEDVADQVEDLRAELGAEAPPVNGKAKGKAKAKPKRNTPANGKAKAKGPQKKKGKKP